MANFVHTTRALLEQMLAPQTEATEKPVDRAHFCATHVEHATFGPGTCISEAHADPDAEGNIAWYTVQFADGTRKIDTADLKVTEGKSHSHSKKPMKESEETVDEANIKHPNQQKLDVHEPEKDELTAKDFEMLRKGKKAEKEDKDDMKESTEQVEEKYVGHKKLTAQLAAKGAKDPAALASWIGRKKYGKAAFQKAAAKGQKMKEEVEIAEDFDLVEVSYEITEQIAIPQNPTFKHYLDAVKTLVNNDSAEAQPEIVALAQEAFDNKEIDILIKAEVQAMNEAGAIKMPTATGMKVMGTRYGNSAEAERNRTKKFVDTLSGPGKKAMDKMEKSAKAKK